MTALTALKESSQIEINEMEQITKIIFDSILNRGNYKSETYVNKKEKMLESLSDLLQQYLKLNFTGTKENKIQLMKFATKLNRQKELLELYSGATNLKDITEAGQRLGKKSQSAFKSK